MTDAKWFEFWQRTVLIKIRAEIELAIRHPCRTSEQVEGLQMALDIVDGYIGDKYKRIFSDMGLL